MSQTIEPTPFPAKSSRRRAGLAVVRSVLSGLVGLGILGIGGAVASYRADVGEARRQVHERVAQRCQLYVESLELHFDLLRAELQRLGDRISLARIAAPDPSLLSIVRDDRNLFAGGVAVFDLGGKLLWADPLSAFGAEDVRAEEWFDRARLLAEPVVDAFRADDSSRIAIALPIREGERVVGLLVGVVSASDRLLYGVEGPSERLFLLSSQRRVLLPVREPDWTRSAGFVELLDRALGDPSVIVPKDLVLAARPVPSTALSALAIETEAVAIRPIRQRLELQLGFLLLLQVGAVGAFTVFLRRTWREFLGLEAKAVEQEKLAALGVATTLIAHEIKNSLNGLKGAAALFEAGGDPDLAGRTVRGQTERLGHLASSLLSFARPSATRLAEVDVADVVREAVEVLDALPERSEADVELLLPETLPHATDRVLLLSAVDNLVRNAIEAAVAANDLGRCERARVLVTATRSEGELVVAVEDEAGGPPEDFESWMGEPFATRKPRGIGLGLAMTRQALERLGGRLGFVRTARGSRFEIRLPTPVASVPEEVRDLGRARHAPGR